MATDILSDIFALRNIRCFSHMAMGSPQELEMKTSWETTASRCHHSGAYSQSGISMACPWGTCGLSHLQLSPKLVEVSQNPLGTSHPSAELTQLSPLKLNGMSFGGEVGNSRHAKSRLPREQVLGIT